MKRIMVILFRIIYISILIAVVLAIVFSKINRMKGSVEVTIDGENYPLESVECKYIGENGDENIKCNKTSSGIKFKNPGMRHGMYEYSFSICNQEISINPKIRVFKTCWYKIYNSNMEIHVYKDDEAWNADVSVKVNDSLYQETFYDIENNPIELRTE